MLCGEFFRLEELTLLYDSWRYWPNNPSFEATVRRGRMPLTIPSPDQRRRTLSANEANLRRVWSENAQKVGVESNELPRIKYKNLKAMETAMEKEA